MKKMKIMGQLAQKMFCKQIKIMNGQTETTDCF